MTADDSSFSTDSLLWQRWVHHANTKPQSPAVIHWVAGETPFVWTWSALIDRASQYAAQLQTHGVHPGDVCATVIRHHREFYPIYMGIEAAGALPAVLAYPNPRLHPDKFRQGLEGMAKNSGLDFILTERALEPMVRPLASGDGSTIREILFPLEWDSQGLLESSVPLPHPQVNPDQPCLLQHSSGTTGLQKAIMLSHRTVLEHANRYGKAIAMNSSDKVISWLPLYHDMGLIAAFHLPLAFGIPTVQIDPFEWIIAPVLLLDAISSEKGTLAWLPNFAYNLMADRIDDRDLEGVRLDSLRLLINCSEPVRAASHEKFATRFSQIGLEPGALSACYAMAETTFAVTQSSVGTQAPVLRANRDELGRGRFVPASGEGPATSCVCSGAPIAGCEVRIIDDGGQNLPEDRIGEILISSVSMFDGYRNNPEKTAQVLRDGWYHSGDYGFIHDGQVYVIGRKKDIIIVAGKNLYPEDIEDAVNTVIGVIPGRVIAFGAEDETAGTEQVYVIAETTYEDPAQRKALRSAIVEAAMRIDITLAKVLLAPPRWLIKSSSGKPSRSANRPRALSELSPTG
jgi:fatty-acyl-CoA synthase